MASVASTVAQIENTIILRGIGGATDDLPKSAEKDCKDTKALVDLPKPARHLESEEVEVSSLKRKSSQQGTETSERAKTRNTLTEFGVGILDPPEKEHRRALEHQPGGGSLDSAEKLSERHIKHHEFEMWKAFIESGGGMGDLLDEKHRRAREHRRALEHQSGGGSLDSAEESREGYFKRQFGVGILDSTEKSLGRPLHHCEFEMLKAFIESGGGSLDSAEESRGRHIKRQFGVGMQDLLEEKLRRAREHRRAREPQFGVGILDSTEKSLGRPLHHCEFEMLKAFIESGGGSLDSAEESRGRHIKRQSGGGSLDSAEESRGRPLRYSEFELWKAFIESG